MAVLTALTLLAAAGLRPPLLTAEQQSDRTFPASLPLRNPTFEAGLAGWELAGQRDAFRVVEADGRPAGRIVIPNEVEPTWWFFCQVLAVKPGDIVAARAEAAIRDLRNGYGTFCALNYYDGAGKLVAQARSDTGEVDGSWSTLTVRSIVPESAASTQLALMLNGRGTALFRDAHAELIGTTKPEPLRGPVTLRVTEEVVCQSLVGFGAEDDGWFYNAVNRKHGVTEADYALRERRIEWMDPDWARMFSWYPDWCPSGDWETFTFDSDNMRSKYRTLDLYQRIGAAVNLVGVRWGVQDPYADPEAFVRANGELLDHLIKGRGYTCVRCWTLLNEPNLDFRPPADRTFAEFVRLHQLMKDELAHRGLDVRLVGSDDAQSLRWFERCVGNRAYYNAVDLFASHRYYHSTEHGLVSHFFEDRLPLLKTRAPRKPFVVGEYGFLPEQWTSHHNPLMKTYPYAIRTAEFCLEALNYGAAGACIWTVHEMYYTDEQIMDSGLWDYKDNDWQIRPAYHAAAMFSRLTEPGDRVRRVISSHPRRVKAALVGRTLFWVNAGDGPLHIVLEGFAPSEARLMTEANLRGDRECGDVAAIRNGTFVAPAQSFGYCVP